MSSVISVKSTALKFFTRTTTGACTNAPLGYATDWLSLTPMTKCLVGLKSGRPTAFYITAEKSRTALANDRITASELIWRYNVNGDR